MPIDFPDSPQVNDVFTIGNRSWVFNNSRWELVVIIDEGPIGPPGIVIDSVEPIATDILWADTSEEGAMVIPTGGLTGQVLVKISNSDYDSDWASVTTNVFPDLFMMMGA